MSIRSEVGDDQELSFAITPDPGLEEARLVWRGDLNADGIQDLAVRFPKACGNWGECPFAVYAGCNFDTYIPVWGPEYAVSLKIGSEKTAVDAAGWLTLRDIQRNTESGRAYAYTRTLRFNGQSYQIAPGSIKRLK